MDGEVSAKWRTVEGNAIEGEDYEGGKGVVTFAHNQVSELRRCWVICRNYKSSQYYALQTFLK